MQERRHFKRWKVAIPCTVEWEDSTLRGQIKNISFGGALITQVNAVPLKGALVVVTVPVQKDKVVLDRKVCSRVVHTFSELTAQSQPSSFGVKFGEPLEVIQSKLNPIFRTFACDEHDNH